jgi:hypothetical protein
MCEEEGDADKEESEKEEDADEEESKEDSQPLKNMKIPSPPAAKKE